MHHDSGVTEHRFGPRGRDDKMATAIRQRIAQVIKLAFLFLVDDLEIRHRGLQHRVPVGEPLAAVQKPLLVEAHEHFGDRGTQIFIEREVLAAPVDRRAQPSHLLGDGSAGVFDPIPDLFRERLAAHRAAVDAIGLQLSLDHDLCGDARVVGAGQPQRRVAEHPVVAGQRVHDRLVKRVTHVQDAGHVRRRQLDRERGLRRIEPGAVVAALFPYRRPARLDRGGLEALGERRETRCGVVHCTAGRSRPSGKGRILRGRAAETGLSCDCAGARSRWRARAQVFRAAARPAPAAVRPSARRARDPPPAAAVRAAPA